MPVMNFCPAARVALTLSCCFALLVVLSGCKREDKRGKNFTPPNPNAPALYGPMTNATTAQATLARIAEPFPAAAWTSAPLAVLQTELSPATLIHSTSKYLSLFAGSTNVGLGAPSHVAWSKPEGPRSFKPGEKMEMAQMQEGWVLVWWEGAAGWTNFWDSPWVVFLQHRPKSARLDADGLHFVFPAEAGDVVLMPLYGYEKAPLPGKDERAAHRLTKRKVPLRTWDWAQGLTRDPLTRIRYWASVTRELPIRCEEIFSVDRANDTVTIRSRFERHSIRDDWNTPSLKLSPISPTLALAAKAGAFPVRFSRPQFDLEMPTPFGPLTAVEGVDEFDATLSVLQYLNETEAVSVPDTNAHPAVARALEKLREEGRLFFATPSRGADLCQALSGDAWLARALPFYDASTRSNAVVSFGRYFREEVLVTNRFVRRAMAGSSGRGQWLLKCPGTNDPGRYNPVLLEALWAYAHFSGDWNLVRERWPLVKGLFVSSAQTSWPGFGSAAPAAFGDQAAHASAFARLAWQAGDLAAYHEACEVFARELAQVCLKHRGADYFRQLQPWHSMEFMDDEVFVTHLGAGPSGWQLDGPTHPAQARERQFDQRWARFKDADVARYLRENFPDDLQREMRWLQRRWSPEQSIQNVPHALPSLVQLRSLLQNEPAAGLVTNIQPDQFTGPSAGKMASCLAVLRAASPLRYQRLLPPGPPTSFVACAERDAMGPMPSLVSSLTWGGKTGGEAATNALSWPALIWPAWRTPTGAPWSFGQIRATRNASLQKARELPLNANTQVILFE